MTPEQLGFNYPEKEKTPEEFIKDNDSRIRIIVAQDGELGGVQVRELVKEFAAGVTDEKELSSIELRFYEILNEKNDKRYKLSKAIIACLKGEDCPWLKNEKPPLPEQAQKTKPAKKEKSAQKKEVKQAEKPDEKDVFDKYAELEEEDKTNSPIDRSLPRGDRL